MHRFTLRRASAASVLTLAALAISACTKGGSSVAVPVSPTATATPLPNASLGSIGVAYLPDGGNVPGFLGVQVVHFEDIRGNLLASSPLQNVTFPGSVGAFGIATDGTVAFAAQSAGAGAPYTQLQDVFGAATGNIVPSGQAYTTTVGGVLPTQPPTTNATPAPSASPSAAPTPIAAAVIPDVSSIAVLGTGTNSVGVAAGSGAAGFIAVTSLINSPPVFGGYVPFAASPSVALPPGTRGSIAVSSDLRTALVRGADLVSYSIAQVGSGFQFTLAAQNGTLGLNPATALRGRGAFAIAPNDGSRAVIAQAPTANQVTLVTGLPGAIAVGGSVTLGSTPRSVAIAPTGGYALVGTDAGLYVLSGVLGGTLTTLPTFAGSAGGGLNTLPFTGCDNVPRLLTNITSVGVSADGRYGVAFGNVPSGCAGNGVLVAFPISGTGGLATPAPNPVPSATPFAQYFVQTNLGGQPTSADAMFVR